MIAILLRLTFFHESESLVGNKKDYSLVESFQDSIREMQRILRQKLYMTHGTSRRHGKQRLIPTTPSVLQRGIIEVQSRRLNVKLFAYALVTCTCTEG